MKDILDILVEPIMEATGKLISGLQNLETAMQEVIENVDWMAFDAAVQAEKRKQKYTKRYTNRQRRK